MGMRRGWGPWLLTAAVAAALVLRGCTGGEVVDDPPTVTRVFISGTEQLVQPVMGHDASYVSQYLFHMTPEETPEGDVSGFYLEVLTSRPDDLKLRMVDTQTGAVRRLLRVGVPAIDPLSYPGGYVPLYSEIEQALRAGQGVFWLTASPTDQRARRVGVMIREVDRSALVRLDTYVDESSSGAPVGGQSIQLARDFFYLAAIGDSAMWGNGLRTEDKFVTLVAREIEQRLGRKVIWQNHAISGATIVRTEDDDDCPQDCPGEVPTAYKSITAQAEDLESPEELDLILVDGCGNDVGLSRILDPQGDLDELEEVTERYCSGRMRGLLRKVRTVAPQAPIVVTAYFPFVSAQTEIEDLETWVGTQEGGLLTPDELAESLVNLTANSTVFYETSTASLTAAVADASSDGLAGPGLVLANAGFGPQNAVFAPQAWLWGLTTRSDLAERLNLDVAMELFPEDPLLDYRLRACSEADVRPDLITCIYASVGHPNTEGARALARAVITALEGLAVLEEPAD